MVTVLSYGYYEVTTGHPIVFAGRCDAQPVVGGLNFGTIDAAGLPLDGHVVGGRISDSAVCVVTVCDSDGY